MNRSSLRKRFSKDGIYVRGAREHNLKNINVFIPRNKITVITGLSGSGKSSLAFDTIYAEGQRRYLESLSAYSRYFIDQMKRPEVDGIYGLSPGIAVHQKTIVSNPRSTVGTATGAYDYIRLLYARLGEVFCPRHNISLKGQAPEEIATDILKIRSSAPIWILAPVARGKKGEFAKEFNRYVSMGYDRARVDGKWVDLGTPPRLEKRKDHFIDLLLDKVPPQRKYERRIHQAVERALSLSKGYVKVEDGKGFEKNHSLHFSCPRCDYAFFDLEPAIFSFNSPKGACSICGGTGLSFSREFEDGEGEEEESLYVERAVCSACKGSRLKEESLTVRIKGKNISDLSSLSTGGVRDFVSALRFKGAKKQIAEKIIPRILFHIDFLNELGLGYLSLNRSVSALSGGEAQRLRLVSQLSSPLIGVLYVLDEPSIGLHCRDHGRILDALKTIRDRGNTVVMVEHDEESIRYADEVIDLGPLAGVKGGHITARGSLRDIIKNPKSLTGAYLSGKEVIPPVKSLWTGREPLLEIKGAKKHNLKSIDVKIPLGRVVGVSGVSGSGKSTLVLDTVYPILFSRIAGQNFVKTTALCRSVKGLKFVDRVIRVTQKPIGKTPRSIPATYVGVFQMIRALFSFLPPARLRGFSPGHFSFNIHGGRCETCKGRGAIKLEMRFLPDVWIPCEVCQGERYHRDILNIRYKGKSISDVLKMTVDEAVLFFRNHSWIYDKLKFLQDVGLGYVALGQSSATLSGGEAQRIKLSRELSRKSSVRTFYVLDEPTTGLHFHDIRRLIELMRRLSEKGHTVVVIEHNLDVLKSCDYLLDLGPEGGERGGRIIAEGPPSALAKNPKSVTGKYLKKILQKPVGRG